MNDSGNGWRPYLMLLNIPKPQPEHLHVKQKLAELSEGTAKAVYFDSKGGAFLFKSKLNLRQIYSRFDGVLLGDDTFFIVELGEHWVTYGHGVAAGWLRTHLGEDG